MLGAIEVQVISRILTSDDKTEVDTLLGFDDSYYSAYSNEIKYIRDHVARYNIVPSPFDFQAQFNDFVTVAVTEPLQYLIDRLREYKQQLLLTETFNKIKDLGEGDVADAWMYLQSQCTKAAQLSNVAPTDLIKDAQQRADKIKEYNSQKRIPTGFPEIDKVMYGGLSTVEELLVLIARTNAGKSWCCTRMMESAQKNGFPVAYYSPEMQAAFLGTRFDTWRGHFENSSLHRAQYSEKYLEYIKNLPSEETSAFVLEDKDFPDGATPAAFDSFVGKHGIKLLIIDGISYMDDDQGATRDQEKYKNIATRLFALSKKHGCAVVLVMQSNREVKNKDDKGESIPDLYNAEGSDHPGRVATQAFGIRQIFDKHVLDIKLLKSRMANNENPVFSYAWDVNTGNVSYIPNNDPSDVSTTQVVPTISVSSATPLIPAPLPSATDISLVEDDSDDIEF